VPNVDGDLDSKLADLKVVIEDTLLAETDDIESNVVVSTTDLTYSLPRNATRLFWFSMLALACIVVFVIGYKWIRFNLMAGLSLATSIALEVVTLVSSLVAFRIPVNYNFVIPFVVMIFTTIINATLMNNSIKAGLNNESYNKSTNADRVLMATKSNLKGIIIYMAILVAAVLGIMFFGNASTIYLGIATLVGLLVSAFVSILINNSLWSFWYKKDKDRVLIRRIDAEKKRLEAKNNKNKQTDEKIVV
jgi:preprotein translocase subunit SecF